MIQKQANFDAMGGLVKFKHGMYNITSDPVWLAAFAKPAKTVLDVGIGTGGASLCYLVHNPDAKITGIDISEQMLGECAYNAKLNNRDLELINTDILKWKTTRTFDLVITNPPYFKGTPAKHNAHHNIDITEWVVRCLGRVRPGGYFCTIIDAGCIGDVISAMTQKHCGDINIFPLFGAKQTAERLIIQGRMGYNCPGRVHSGTSMNNPMVLRDGLTIDCILARL